MATEYKLYGAILGDLAGQPFEFGYKGDFSDVVIHNPNSVFTDDTLMTLATAKAILSGTSFEKEYKDMGARYPGDHYGKGFKEWLQTEIGVRNNSYGNGCLMRVSPIMYLSKGDIIVSLMDATMCSHVHSISIESVLKLYRAYQGVYNYHGDAHKVNKKRFKVEADSTFDLCYEHFTNWETDFLNPQSITQQRIVSIIKLGGDTDTNASIIGELSNFWEKDITKEDVEYVESKLDPYLLSILKEFNKQIK